jgi:hypothetical protein
MAGISIGMLVVTDFRESESWKRARFVLCSILELTRSLSAADMGKSIARKIDRLSMSVLDGIARGYGESGNEAPLSGVRRSIVLLERQLRIASAKGMVSNSEFARLNRELEAVQQSLKEFEP